MKTLPIQLLLRLHGLDHVVDYLKLFVREKDNLVLLKYDQINADWNKPALLDCRGIILDKSNNWNVVAFPYSKFFNITEHHCATIDWDSAKVYQKLDGSLINMYYYNNQWNVQTSGNIDASGDTYHDTLKFVDLFWISVDEVYGSKDIFLSKLNTRYNYMFELCTEWNIVVVPHIGYDLVLHGIRDIDTFEFIDIETTDLKLAKRYDITNLDQMISEFDDMDWDEEGFVVVDKYFNRAKCKNPKYVTKHHLSTGLSPYSVIDIIKTNEVDEYCAYFKHKTAQILDLKTKWDQTLNDLLDTYNKYKHLETDKQFALTIKDNVERCFLSIMFNLRKNGTDNIHSEMCKLDNRFWFNRFK